jgi:tellurite resistance protein TerC
MDGLTSFLVTPWLGMPVWIWLGFLAVVMVILAIDLGLFHSDAHEPSLQESAVLAGSCMALGLAFSAVVWWLYFNGYATSLDATIAGAATPTERAWTAWELYLTGWVVEQTLAFDNVFVISMIFSYLAVPAKYQHRVLFYGILGVVVLRAIMIGLGAALVHQFAWVLYIFSAFLVFTGVKMFMMVDHKPDLENNVVLKWMRRHMRITNDFDGQKFFIQRPDPATGKVVRWATPLFVALILIEVADLIFAVDSVPAIFAITQDPFIVYTSNIFAILGLRALYFVLSAMVHRFHYLKYALALVLIYVGAKIFVQQIIGKIPPEVSLGVTISLLVGGILYSLFKTRGSVPPSVPETPSRSSAHDTPVR